MNARRFPRSPELPANPFENGNNPFADDVQAPASAPSDTNLFKTSVNESVQPFKPVEYVPMLPNRSGTVLRMGILGVVMSSLSLLLGFLIYWVTNEWIDSMIYCLPMGLVGVTVSFPAWRQGHADLKAIAAGAMDQRSARTTRQAYWLGIIGILVGLFPVALGLWSIGMAIFS